MFLTEKERLETLRACRDCPMCHMIDTVATITGRESNTPRGRAMVLWGLEKGLLDWEAEGISSILYQAFLDGLAREWCEGNYDNDELVLDGRKKLVEKGLAPAVVAEVASRVKNTGNPYGVNEEGPLALVEKGEGKISRRPEFIIFFGSAARILRPQVALSLIRILNLLKIPFEILGEETDSGFACYQLGDFASAAVQAKKVVAQLQGCEARKLVVLGAGDFRMLTTRYTRFGASFPEGMRVFHATEFLSELLEDRKVHPRKTLSGRVSYHDPCSLARYAPILDPPRKLLRALAGENFVEMEWMGKKAHPCGGCGGVPFTYPEIAEKAAHLRVEQARRNGAEILASADPDCEAMLSRGQNEIEVKDIVELIAEAM